MNGHHPSKRDICGVGLVLSNDRGSNNVIIGAICPGSPSACSGIIALGDEIVSVDGRCVSDLRASEIAEMLKGDRRTLIRLCLRKAHQSASPYLARVYQVWLVRDRLSETNVTLMSENEISGTLGVEVEVHGSPETGLMGLVITSVEEAGSVWLAQCCVKMGAAFQPTLLTNDRIEAVNSVPISVLEEFSKSMSGPAFTRISLDVYRNGRRILLDAVRTPKLSAENLKDALNRLELIREHTLTLERALSIQGLKCASWISVQSTQKSASGPGKTADILPTQQRNRGQDASAFLDSSPGAKSAEGGLDSPRSTISTDSLDDIVLSLSQSVASRQTDTVCEDEG